MNETPRKAANRETAMRAVSRHWRSFLLTGLAGLAALFLAGLFSTGPVDDVEVRRAVPPAAVAARPERSARGAAAVATTAGTTSAARSDSDGPVRTTAVERWREVAGVDADDIVDDLADGEAIAWLTPRLAHPDPAVRASAALALGDIGGAGAAALLAPALNDEVRAVRLAAVEAIATIGDPASWTLIEPLLFARDQSLRLRAIDTLANLRHPGSVHALAALLGDGDIDVRRAAIAALDEIDGALARDYLEPMRFDPDPAVRAGIEQMRLEWRLAAQR